MLLSDWMTEDEMAAIRKEMNTHNDILIVDMRGFEDPAKKTLAFFSAVAFEYDVDFVFKVTINLLRHRKLFSRRRRMSLSTLTPWQAT